MENFNKKIKTLSEHEMFTNEIKIFLEKTRHKVIENYEIKNILKLDNFKMDLLLITENKIYCIKERFENNKACISKMNSVIDEMKLLYNFDKRCNECIFLCKHIPSSLCVEKIKEENEKKEINYQIISANNKNMLIQKLFSHLHLNRIFFYDEDSVIMHGNFYSVY